MAFSFVPKGQEGLLLRSPLTNGLAPHATLKMPKPIYTKVCLRLIASDFSLWTCETARMGRTVHVSAS